MKANVYQCLVNIIVEPKKAWVDIRNHPAWFWLPLFLTLTIPVAFIIWYYMRVDIAWLGNQMTAHMVGKYNVDQIDRIRAHITRNRMIIFTTLGIVIVTILVDVLQALYYFLVCKVGGYQVQGFGEWFAFATWASIPLIFGPIASGIAFLFSSAQTGYLSLDVTSLNTLIFHLPVYHPLAKVVTGLHVTFFWSLALMIFGFSNWTKERLGKTATIVLIPWVLIYATWIIMKLA